MCIIVRILLIFELSNLIAIFISIVQDRSISIIMYKYINIFCSLNLNLFYLSAIVLSSFTAISWNNSIPSSFVHDLIKIIIEFFPNHHPDDDGIEKRNKNKQPPQSAINILSDKNSITQLIQAITTT